ncbi:OsmC family protein [Arcicella sp. DC2W]|uniref:OsmC family protein n=1 Tax=Arcicella gelida TaxID=2984195 RepID=A0ABU5S6U5_9BACT|nr:OsmC family protein [Arcicella sp. DC2W]MEA5404217.1 OsmC family protein [Arcicella sp. DC2W]
MEKVHAQIGKELYKTTIQTATNTLITDEPVEVGGKDLGFNPKELLAAALAACTSATLRMYADRKAWDLAEVKVEVTFDRDATANKSFFNRKIELIGNLDEEQKARLLTIANSCPVHKILTNPIEVSTELTS